jgi:hypothetical protein
MQEEKAFQVTFVRFFEEPDFLSLLEEAVVGYMPKINDLWNLVVLNQAVEQSHLATGGEQIDNRNVPGEDGCQPGIQMVCVEP